MRGGGHSVTGHAVVNGGLMIDLSPMDGVRVDADTRRAWAQGGARLGQLDHETQIFGLATTAGTRSIRLARARRTPLLSSSQGV
jgi:FAD/FMN-containing dehydrogenase